jgi:hypothetical protein
VLAVIFGQNIGLRGGIGDGRVEGWGRH